MNRTQFWVLNGVSALVVILFITHIVLLIKAERAQAQLASAQQFIQAGQNWDLQVRQLAMAVYQLSQNDAALKDVLVKEGITINNNPENNAPASAPTPSNP